MPSWCLVYRLSTCKFELRFIPRRCLALFVSFIGIFKSGDPEKTRGWQCLIFDFSNFLELLPTSCGPFKKIPPFILVVVNSFKNGFPLAEPSPTRNWMQFSSQCHFLQQFSHSRLTQVQSKMKAVCPNQA